MNATLDIAAHMAGLSVLRVPSHKAKRLRMAIQVQMTLMGEGMWQLDCLDPEKHEEGRESFRRAVALGELLDQLDWFQPEDAIEKDRELVGEADLFRWRGGPGEADLFRWLLFELRHLMEDDEKGREWFKWLGEAQQQIGGES